MTYRVDLSFVNYNCIGLHSLVLSPPPRMRRIFFTTPNHELADPRTVGLHAHHCALTFTPLYGCGTVTHWRTAPPWLPINVLRAAPGWQVWGCYPFAYSSSLRDGDDAGKKVVRRFTRAGNPAEILVQPTAFEGCSLAASDIHTLSVLAEAQAAWLVEEGEEDPDYDPRVWSSRDLSLWRADGLYLPMDSDFLGQNAPLLLRMIEGKGLWKRMQGGSLDDD